MDIVLIVTTAITLCAAIPFALTLVNRQHSGKKETGTPAGRFTVRRPKKHLYAGTAGSVFSSGCITLATAFPNQTAAWWVFAIFISCLLACFWLIADYFVWKIVVRGNEIRVTALFKKTKNLTFADFTSAKLTGERDLAVYVNEKQVLNFESSSAGSCLFYNLLALKGIKITKQEHYEIKDIFK